MRTASSKALPWSLAQATDAVASTAVAARSIPATAAKLPTGADGSVRPTRPAITAAQITTDAAAYALGANRPWANAATTAAAATVISAACCLSVEMMGNSWAVLDIFAAHRP